MHLFASGWGGGGGGVGVGGETTHKFFEKENTQNFMIRTKTSQAKR